MDADVLVIGAGAAGLAAARILARRSLRVVILEARDRVGGRAWSHSATRALAPAELGAEFIHGRAEETMALLREAGTIAVSVEGDDWAVDEDGKLRPAVDDFRAGTAIFDAACTLAEDESVDRFLHRFDGDGSMAAKSELARSFVEGFDAADPTIVSVRGVAEELRSGVDFASSRPIGGYRLMFDCLRKAAQDAGAAIRLSTIVRTIAWKRGLIAVEAATARGEPVGFRARAAVVTLPAGVLRHSGDESAIVFQPELPPAKREALGLIESGHVVRVALWFRTAFWEELHDGRYRGASFFRPRGSSFGSYWTQFPIRNELIIAWAGGPRATAMSGLSSTQLIERALEEFGALLGEPAVTRANFEGGATHAWFDDPFARGAYSYLAVGGVPARGALAAPVDDSLFFAGEATSTNGQGGTVNGALQTGERAANEVMKSLEIVRN